MITLSEFIINLKQSKVYTIKQAAVIDFISIYVNESKVYKVIVAVNPQLMKKAKRLGFEGQYKTIFFDDVAIDMSELKNKRNNGRCIIMYYPNDKNNDISVYEGEVDEQTQMSKLKRARMNRA